MTIEGMDLTNQINAFAEEKSDTVQFSNAYYIVFSSDSKDHSQIANKSNTCAL